MNLFSISQLAQYSGIKPHTIRIWEQRYNALSPNRTKGNTRYYDNSQLRRLLNIVSLMESGHKVSELGPMSDKKIFQLLEEITNWDLSNDPTEYFISQLIAAGMSYDEAHFEKTFSHCLLRFGMNSTYIKIIYPVLDRIGFMWATDKIPPTQEHFISNLIRQKLFTAIDYIPAANSSADSWLLFLPENEFHEIGLLFAYYLIRLSGRKALYLGVNVPQQSLVAAVNDSTPKNLLFFLVHNDFPDQVQSYLNGLSTAFASENIYFSGNQNLIRQLAPGKNIQWLQSVEDLQQLLPYSHV